MGEVRLVTEHARNLSFRCDRSGHDDHSVFDRCGHTTTATDKLHEQGDPRPDRDEHDGTDAEVVTHG